VGFNLPAQAENDACGPLQRAYIANPAARPILLGQLQTFGCSIPGTSTSSSSSSTSSSSTSSSSTSTSTTSTTTLGCANLQATYRTNPAAASTILPLLQALGCSIPVTTTSSSTSSTVFSTVPPNSTTSTTVGLSSACPSLVLSYNSITDPAARAQLLPVLTALGCSVNPT
jgi:hypothetical protein